jgi:hypothetical protein
VNGQLVHKGYGFSTDFRRIFTPKSVARIRQSVAIRGQSAPDPWRSVKFAKTNPCAPLYKSGSRIGGSPDYGL